MVVVIPLQTNVIFYKARFTKARMVHCIHRGVTGYDFPKNSSFSDDRVGLV